MASFEQILMEAIAEVENRENVTIVASSSGLTFTRNAPRKASNTTKPTTPVHRDA